MAGARYIILAALLGVACGGKPPPIVTPVGERVRVTARELDVDRYDGRVAALTPDTLTVDSLAIPIAVLTRLDVHRGRKGNASLGASIGMFSGGAGFLVLSLATCEDGFIFDKGECTAFGALFGLVAGAGLGAIIGAFVRTDRWEEFPSDRLQVIIAPDRVNHVGVGVRLRF